MICPYCELYTPHGGARIHAEDCILRSAYPRRNPFTPAEIMALKAVAARVNPDWDVKPFRFSDGSVVPWAVAYRMEPRP